MRLDRILFGIGFAFLVLAIGSFVIVRKKMDAYGIPMGTFSPMGASIIHRNDRRHSLHNPGLLEEDEFYQVKYIDKVRGFAGFQA